MSDKSTKIPIDDQGINDLYQLAKDANQLFAQVNNEYLKTETKYLDGYLDYSSKVIQIVGILAGFGFTAVSKVQTLWLFILGELLLVGAIVFGLVKTRNIFTSTLKSIPVARKEKAGVVWERNKYLTDVLREATTNGNIPADLQDQLNSHNQKMLDAFTLKDDKDDKLQDHLVLMIILAAAGVLSVLLSFL